MICYLKTLSYCHRFSYGLYFTIFQVPFDFISSYIYVCPLPVVMIITFKQIRCHLLTLSCLNTCACCIGIKTWGINIQAFVEGSVVGFQVITGPPTQYCFALWRLSSLSVVICNTPRLACRRLHPCRQGDDSCRLQSNYSSTVTLHVGPLVLRPFRATPCY